MWNIVPSFLDTHTNDITLHRPHFTALSTGMLVIQQPLLSESDIIRLVDTNIKGL